MTDTPPPIITVDDLARAIDNSTPYPIELNPTVCRYMAERLLEMLTVAKRTDHDMWQREEPPPPAPGPISPDFTSPIAGRIEVRDPCPHCGDHQLIPRHRMAEHISWLHPDERT